MTKEVITSRGLTVYQVENGVDDVVAQDHNTLYDDSYTLATRFIGKVGAGEHGKGVLGALTNPTGSVSASLNGSGPLTGDFRYKVTFFNLSGETTGTTDTGGDITASGHQILVQGIPVSAQTSLTQGRKVYRSADNGATYALVGTIYDNVSTTFDDDVPSGEEGAAIPGSNTTGTTGTIDPGNWYFSSLTVGSGQTLTLNAVDDDLDGWLGLFVAGTVSISGTIDGSGKGPDRGLNSISAVDHNSAVFANMTGDAAIMQTTTAAGLGSGRGRQWRSLDLYQGKGGNPATPAGDGVSGVPGKPGATIFIKASGAITFGTASLINCKGANATNSSSASSGAAGGAGAGAGGCIYILSDTSIAFPSGAELRVSGGTGGNAAGSGGASTSTGGGGGGGGLTMLCAPSVTNSGTHTVSGGSNGTNNTTGTGAISEGGGGGNVGRGAGISGVGLPSVAGGTVIIQRHPMHLNFAGMVA